MAYRYVYGPVPSRRMGLSVGIEPIPAQTCNYSCVYCQLGRTRHMTNTRKQFFDPEEILEELKTYLTSVKTYDVVTLVGDGEPTLYAGLGDLLRGIKGLTDKPVAVITNGALLYDPQLRRELSEADLVLPSMDAPDRETFKKINRPHGSISYEAVMEGLKLFAESFKGQLWIEIMLVKGLNDSDKALEAFKGMLDRIPHDKVFINAPVRPPAEADVEIPDGAVIERFSRELGALSINHLTAHTFSSGIEDDYEAVLSIIARHPMNQHEIASFIESRQGAPESVLDRLNGDEAVAKLAYKGYTTYRPK